MNIESKIRFKAVGLYIVVAIVATIMLFYLYQLRSNIQHQKQAIEKQHHSLALTNELIYAVGEAQSSASLFVSTNDTAYIKQFSRKVASVDSLIGILSVTDPAGKGKLRQISRLLARQVSNISELNRQLNSSNPLSVISERIQNYKPIQHESLRIATVKKDTIFNTTGHKNIFRRFKEVFVPDKDKAVVVTSQHIDTLQLGNSESYNVLTEVGKIASTADKRYKENMQSIGQQVVVLIASDREISTQISGLLLQLHRQTFDSVLGTISKSEQSINRNYTISIIGGIFAMALIFVFIMLIIYDVNKGKEAREKLRQVMESRHQLLLSVSHDIKSPLGSILGYLELHQQELDVKSMQSSARHILSLLENLLEFSSLEQGSLTISNADFSLQELCNEIGQMFLPLAEAKKLSFSFYSDNVRIHSDYMKIKQIIINLVSNAIKYTRVGKVHLNMTYSVGKFSIELTDTGAGIPEDKQSEIYKPFTRVESNNALAHGSGLGMYVVKGLVELLNGTIHLASKVNEGTKIQVDIPTEKTETIIKKGAKRIALYEDDFAVAEMVRAMLLRLGHQVVDHDYDMILTDMEMGEISGLDILASAGNVPVVVMTGHSDYTTQKARELGFDGFLAKPFTVDALREIFGEGEKVVDDFFGDDLEEIMEIFRNSTAENFSLLSQALNSSDYKKAQAICHKMLPMFAQLGYPIDELRRIDANRAEVYDGWQDDVKTILKIKV